MFDNYDYLRLITIKCEGIPIVKISNTRILNHQL